MSEILENLFASMLILPFMLAAVGALWVGLWLLIYTLCKWIFRR